MVCVKVHSALLLTVYERKYGVRFQTRSSSRLTTTPPASGGSSAAKCCVSTNGARRLTARCASQLSRVAVATVSFSNIEALLTSTPIGPSAAAASRQQLLAPPPRRRDRRPAPRRGRRRAAICGHERLGFGARGVMVHRDRIAGVGQRQHQRAADAAGAAGHQRRLRHRRGRDAAVQLLQIGVRVRRLQARAWRCPLRALARARTLARTKSRADMPARPKVERPRRRSPRWLPPGRVRPVRAGGSRRAAAPPPRIRDRRRRPSCAFRGRR